MNDVAIHVEQLAKQYKIGAAKQRHDTLRDAITENLKSIFHLNGNGSGAAGQSARPSDTIWALKDVCFEVKQGEVLGIIGRNGAGKSTLLKILSRITQPTEGQADLYGRVGSLLEVGTGFHAELTGRENVYLNGAILGMKKTEIDRKFDEIVAFAEVEKFIDTPVKRYSSGMYVRLAFAVAAHLEPEILIIDEVLAVGDISFQNKCIGKMGDVARQGRTVLFVSHNMGAVTNLCATGMWIDNGQVIMHGGARSVVASYIKSHKLTSEVDTRNWSRQGSGEARISKVRLLDSAKQDCTTFSMGEQIIIEFDVEFYRRFPSVNFTLEISRTELSMRVLHLQNDDCGFVIPPISPGMHRFRVEIPNCLLYPTSYEVVLCVWTAGGTLDYVEGAVGFSIVQSNVTRRTQPLSTHKTAIYYTPSIWTEIPLDGSDAVQTRTPSA